MKYNSIGEQLIAKAQELDTNYKPDKFNDMSEALDVILNNSGGKSVPPTLNLIDFETFEVRTTITEEEYNNLENGLYNQVMYDTEAALISVYSPSKLINMGGEYVFVQFKISANADETISYSSMIVNSITIGEKNTSNEYPITIQESAEIPFGGGGGSSSFNIVQINDFSAGSHNQQGFVMPTENMVLFTNGNDTSLIGYREVQNDVPFYTCYRGETVVDSGQFKYEAIAYKITETTLGYNIEKIDLSEVFQINFEFLPDYSKSDNGKVLSVVNGEAKWATPKDNANTNIPSLPADASTKNYALNSINGALTWNTIGNGLVIENGVLKATGSGGKYYEITITRNLFDYNGKTTDEKANYVSYATDYTLKFIIDETNYNVLLNGISTKLGVTVDTAYLINNYNTLKQTPEYISGLIGLLIVCVVGSLSSMINATNLAYINNCCYIAIPSIEGEDSWFKCSSGFFGTLCAYDRNKKKMAEIGWDSVAENSTLTITTKYL